MDDEEKEEGGCGGTIKDISWIEKPLSQKLHFRRLYVQHEKRFFTYTVARRDDHKVVMCTLKKNLQSFE